MFNFFKSFLSFIAYRTTKRYNTIKINTLTPTYWDKDTIMLHAVMQLVVDFVEIECSFMELDRPSTLKERLYFAVPWFLRRDSWLRNRDRGLQHLKHLESFYSEKSKSVSAAPKIIQEVYVWWVDKRASRKDSDEWFAEEFDKIKQNTKLSKSQKTKKIDTLVTKMSKLDDKHYQEDTEMLKKIISVRDFMWT